MSEESIELEQLQNEMLDYRRKLAPLPLQEVRELHQSLIKRTQKKKIETFSDRVKKTAPIRWRWEKFKLSCTEFLAKRFNIHIDW